MELGLEATGPAVPLGLEEERASAVAGDDGVKPVSQAKPRLRVKREAPALRSIHVNRATETELCRIKGVGPVLAKRILEYKRHNGNFHGPSDLDKVAGIGKKKMDNLLPFLIFD